MELKPRLLFCPRMLYFAPPVQGQRYSPEAQMTNTRKILIVDDSATERHMLTNLLTKAGYDVLASDSGEDAIEKARQIKPDLILMDVQLPKMSGIDATRRLREAPETAATPILVITSFALSGDEQKARDAGATGYLAKPYRQFDLLQRIRQLVPEG